MKQGKSVITLVMFALAAALAVYFGVYVYRTFNVPYTTTLAYQYTVNDSVPADGLLARQESCFFGDIHEVLPISKATVSQHLKELKDAGLIQGEIETPKVRYCINRENWEIASRLFGAFWGRPVCKKESCCE